MPSKQSPESSVPKPATVDCETAVLLRAVVLPIFDDVQNWTALIDAMKAKGYRIGFRGATFSVIDDQTGKRLCGLRFLGLSMEDLVARLGRPKVIVRPGTSSDGDLMRDPSDLPST